ncbi:MAG: LysR family transcriptional regulator [Proteobacteria bacterium]|nr:MAG: LysR family transcriptional regulator [Pseudomonadota bacterium]
MDIQSLRAFKVVAEELNFRRAAEILSMSQPPLTRLIARLEDELGVQLFTRTTRRVEITAAGLTLLSEAREILDRILIAEKRVREVGALRRGKLRINFSSLAFYSALPKLLASYREHFPKVAIEMHEKTMRQIYSDLERGKVDLIVSESPFDEEGCEAINISQDDLGVLLPVHHSLAKRKKLKLNELAGESFILHPRTDSPRFYDAIRSFMDEHKFAYKVRMRKRGESCPVLVATDHGLLLSVRSTFSERVPGTLFVPLESPAPKVGIYAVWKKSDAEVSTELQSLISFLRERSSVHDACGGCLMGTRTKQEVE